MEMEKWRLLKGKNVKTKYRNKGNIAFACEKQQGTAESIKSPIQPGCWHLQPLVGISDRLSHSHIQYIYFNNSGSLKIHTNTDTNVWHKVFSKTWDVVKGNESGVVPLVATRKDSIPF